MILLDHIQRTAIDPAMALLPKVMDSAEARVMLLSVGLQESRFMWRFQKLAGRPYEKGPARGYWQFEAGGGVKGVMKHPATEKLAREVCDTLYVPWSETQIHATLEHSDTLAAAFARLLLWADRLPLPKLTASHDEAWLCYVRGWQPGKPHRETWDEFHAQALGQVVA